MKIEYIPNEQVTIISIKDSELTEITRVMLDKLVDTEPSKRLLVFTKLLEGLDND